MTSGRNLTRVAAERRAALIDVVSYDITLDLADESGGPREGTFRTATTIRFRCSRPASTESIDVAAERIVEATLNGAALDTRGWAVQTGLPLPALAAENELRVVADFEYVAGRRGMHRSVDPADGELYLYTSFEPAAAQLVFACFDQPDLKATFTWHVRIPARWQAISNMPASGREIDATGAAVVHFAASPRMSTYLNAICAGPYAEVRRSVDGRDLGIYCRPSLCEYLDADEVFDLTRRGMDFFEKQFGQPYPLPKYDHVAVPEYQGAMENFGCIVFGERFLIFRSTPTEADRVLRGMIILHELAHMWFGDLVTMQWWDDLWLNEAFATWAAFWSMAEATDLPEPWAVFAIEINRAGIEADQLSSTHPISADIPDVESTETNFDAITYRKGASVLKQLAAYVGIDAFTAALRAYFAERAWGNATFDDLVGALVAASGRPVREFATVWLGTAQVNTLRPELMVAADGRYTGVAVLQEAPAGYPTLRTHRMAVGLYDLVGAQLVRRERIELEVQGARTEIPALHGVRAADVLLLNDDDLTYAKVRLDERSLASVLDNIQRFGSALARATCWAAAADMVNDAEMATRDLLTLVCNGLLAENNATLINAVVATMTRALDHYADPAWAPQGWARFADLCHDAALAAEPGSSVQLTWVRAFAGSARTPAQLEILRGWYQGNDLPAGLQLEPDLRWLMLQGLVAFGAVGSAEIDEAAARDRSVTGERHQAGARALIPTAEAKAAAWRSIVDGHDRSMELRLASMVGYSHPAHAALTRSQVPAYLSALDGIYREHGREIGRYFAMVAFPDAHASAETLAAVDAWLAGEHAPALIRLVTDGRDQMVRALAARARDAAAAPSPLI